MPKTKPTPEPEMIELDEAATAAVAGGINPQPLPPRHEDFHVS